MNMKDRTAEFYALAERIKKRGNTKNKQSSLIDKRNTSTTKTRSEFSRLAAQLGRNIAATSEKLEQLTYLTKSNNGFNDNPTKVNTLQQSLKQDITKLNNQLKILQSVKNGNRSNSKQASEHSNNVIMSLQSKLADTSLGFKDILEAEVVTHNNASASQLSSSPQPRRRVNAHPYQDSPNLTNTTTSTTYDESPQSLGIPMISQQQQQQQQMLERNDRRIESRTNAMESIESTIAELGGIFQQLATMVAEQRETIQRIDQNTDDIEMNVLGAQSELLKYYQNISTNRALIIKIFVTIILFFLLFTYIL
ncbi:t-SNARE [Mucor lusitanicus]|uniref:t-SNARE n=1 Tax=Mucor circinelloides f. lusitanicus TaxID=29924 RepID=A0A8H4BKQ7_MUCCL|nr:t-SNARE [Mucor lusitanicus]